MCVLDAVARLLLLEKPKCNVAIWAKIKVRSLCMFLSRLTVVSCAASKAETRAADNK